MQYPLPEVIGNPDLLVGRVKEFGLLDQWLDRIPERLGKSRVILARRKSGKTGIVQRIFNRLWSAKEIVIPFYFSIPEVKMWYPEFAIKYYRAFASQYISFFERDEKLVNRHLSLKQIREYGLQKSISLFVDDVDSLSDDKSMKYYGLMWETAYTAPNRFASFYDQRLLVILDEFQNISQYIYRDEACKDRPDETLAGSFHEVVESKIAPMLVTGSYVGWLLMLIDKYLEAARLKRQFMNPYLTPEEGLQAVYKYSEIFKIPITNTSAEQINCLCMSDPFFISCVIQSEYEEKDLTTKKGVINTVNYEITDSASELSMTWGEYIEQTTTRVNDKHGKEILLHLSKHVSQDWTPLKIKNTLKLNLSEKEIRDKLEIMVKADVIAKPGSDIDYQGLQDGTLNLILRHRFEKEISSFAPDLKKEFNEQLNELKKERNSLRGRLNNLIGKFAEFQLMTELRTKKRFVLLQYFEGVQDRTRLNIINTRLRYKFQRMDGKEMEIDVLAESQCKRVILAEVKKTRNKSGLPLMRAFHEKILVFANQHPHQKVLPVFLSVGGFTKGARKFAKEKNIGTAESIAFDL